MRSRSELRDRAQVGHLEPSCGRCGSIPSFSDTKPTPRNDSSSSAPTARASDAGSPSQAGRRSTVPTGTRSTACAPCSRCPACVRASRSASVGSAGRAARPPGQAASAPSWEHTGAQDRRGHLGRPRDRDPAGESREAPRPGVLGPADYGVAAARRTSSMSNLVSPSINTSLQPGP